jgi:uncharacterized protein (DUF486 family)
MKRAPEPDASIETKTSPSRGTLRGLDWLNFFLADVQGGRHRRLAQPGHRRFHRASLRFQRGLSLPCRGRLGRIWHPLPRHAGDTRETISESNRRSANPMSTILLLALSNVFMTFAWYGHLKYGHDWPLWKAIALLEYCLAVPANRLGYGQFSGFQLKMIQEIVTLVVFVAFAITFLKEKLAWNYLVAFVFLGVAAFFAFAFKTPGPAV